MIRFQGLKWIFHEVVYTQKDIDILYFNSKWRLQ